MPSHDGIHRYWFENLTHVMTFLVLWPICWSYSRVHYENGETGEQPSSLSFWWDFCNVIWFRVVFPFSWSIFFKKNSFISACLMVSVFNSPKYFQVSFGRSEFSLMWLFQPFRHLSFSAFNYLYGTFFYAIFHPNILTLHPHCLY